MSSKKAKSARALHPWSKDSLLIKSQRYAEEMLEHDRDDWKFAFWSTFTLEMLARAALGHISPALLADTKDKSNLHYALGHEPKANKFIPKSTDITDVFSQLHELIADFDLRLKGFSALHMSRRNEEVHSGSTPFESVGNADWLPLFYETLDVLAHSMNDTLRSIIGVEESNFAASIISAAKDESAKAVAKSIEAHKLVWASRTITEQKLLTNQARIWAVKQSGHRVPCPSCKSTSLVFGTPIAAPTHKLKDGLIIETQSFLPSKFECIACGLKISGLPQLHASRLADTYKATFTYDPVEYYAPSDDYSGYEEDNNEF